MSNQNGGAMFRGFLPLLEIKDFPLSQKYDI